MRVAEDLDPTALKRSQSKPAKPTPTAEQVLDLFRDCPQRPRQGLLTSVELRAAFVARGWDHAAAPALRDRLDGQGRLKIWHGPNNAKLCGLPAVVDAFQREQDEAGTVLEQVALPTKPIPKRRRRK